MVKRKKKRQLPSNNTICGDNDNGILYIVGTPIGNLDDISLRALKVLNSVTLIAAEDTRHTSRLLNHCYITTRLISYHDFNKEKQTDHLISILLGGGSVALVSDAGTPAISDPAYFLLQKAYKQQIKVVPIPGASAVTSLLSVSGAATDRFTFYGFFPKKQKARLELVDTIRTRDETAVLFEAPHRIQRTLQELAKELPHWIVILGRELTKIHETITRGTAGELADQFQDLRLKGEMTLVISPPARNNSTS